MKNLLTTMMILAFMLAAGSALAGAKIDINENATLDLGYRVQALGIMTDREDFDKDGQYDSTIDFKLRRARLRLGAKVGEHMTAFLQTDVASGNKPVEMIDAWVNFKTSNWLQFIMGRNMAPANRQNLTSSGALMAIDRPGMAYKSLTWGARALYGFSNYTYAHSGAFNSAASSPDAVRDQGLTIFGSGKLGEQGNLKYYAGIYDGIQVRDPLTDIDPDTGEEIVVQPGPFENGQKKRMTFRAQYNLWDGEAGYYNSSTYLGKKKTLGIGVSYDMQDAVGEYFTAPDTTQSVDYAYMSADAFLEYPFDNGNALTVEVGYMNLDFNDDPNLLGTQGNGFYGQAGYYLASGFQPWVEFESFSSDEKAVEGGDNAGKVVGDYTNLRFGVTYYLEGQAANIKAGYEIFTSDYPVGREVNSDGTPGAWKDSYGTFILGFYTTY